MTPTVDGFRALARSSPWRFRTLHFAYAAGSGPVPPAPESVECWLRRPDDLVVVENGRRHEVSEAGTSSTAVVSTAAGGGPPPGDHDRPLGPDPVTWRPPLRPDGLVADRPDELRYGYDAPMWENYYFVAMLDPVELSHDVAVDALREEEIGGRPAWWAELRPGAGYDPRCGSNCCELLWSRASWYADFEGPEDPDAPPVPADVEFPDHYEVALDVQTGVVVRSVPVGGSGAPWLQTDILEVDTDIDADIDAVLAERGLRRIASGLRRWFS